MSVKYKQSGDWKDISSSSNNAVDTVADGNMNPVTSNAVYDAIKDSCRLFSFATNSTARLYFDRSYDFSAYISASTNYCYVGSINIAGPWLNNSVGTVFYFRYTNNTEDPMFTITNRTSTYVDVTSNMNLYVTERPAKVV